jgi:hypothetical protein
LLSVTVDVIETALVERGLRVVLSKKVTLGAQGVKKNFLTLVSVFALANPVTKRPERIVNHVELNENVWVFRHSLRIHWCKRQRE